MRLKSKEMKQEDFKKVVASYREKYQDWSRVPVFHLRCLASDGSRGVIRLYRKEKAGPLHYSADIIWFASHEELIQTVKGLRRAWDETNPVKTG